MTDSAQAPARALRATLAAVGLSLALGLSGCGHDPAATTAPAHPWHVVSAGSITPGDAVPAPTGTVVLTLTGTKVTNVDDELRLDLDLLDSLGVVEYSVFDHQAEGRDVSFSGPLLRDLLDVAGVAHTATLHCLALNDYDVDVPASDAWDYPVLLATRADDARMDVEHYGPTRLVYPTRGFELDETVFDPRWVWQLKTIEVR
jgi:hypothetical protein